jgi:hypothetical protein
MPGCTTDACLYGHDLDGGLSRRLLAWLLRHRYSCLDWYFHRFPGHPSPPLTPSPTAGSDAGTDILRALHRLQVNPLDKYLIGGLEHFSDSLPCSALAHRWHSVTG